MPGPDPTAVWIEEGWDGRLTATYEVFLVTNRTARRRRALAILRNVQRGGWLCYWCNEPVPHFRRADARFCCESCRKKAARWRRHGLGAAVYGAKLRVNACRHNNCDAGAKSDPAASQKPGHIYI